MKVSNPNAQPLVIIGTGLAGYLLAKACRKRDPSRPLIMITKDDGAFYSKPMLSVALHQGKSPDELVTADANTMSQELSARLLTHTTVTAIDRKRKQIHCGKQHMIPYGHLVLACGASPRHIALEGDVSNALRSVNHLTDYRAFRHWLDHKKHIVVVGSGLVGTEFAHDLSRSGLRVTVVSLDQTPLSRFIPPQTGQCLQEQLTDLCGIKWLMGVTLTAVTSGSRGGFRLQLSDQTHLDADGILSATGLQAHLSLAKQCGLQVRRGIVVDDQLATSDPSIYALGDCAEVAGDWRCFIGPIRHCSEVLAENLCASREHASQEHMAPKQVRYPPMVVMLKTAIYPLSFSMAPVAPVKIPDVQWDILQKDNSQRALCYDQHKVLRGFVVTGIFAKDRMNLLAALNKTNL